MSKKMVVRSKQRISQTLYRITCNFLCYIYGFFLINNNSNGNWK